MSDHGRRHDASALARVKDLLDGWAHDFADDENVCMGAVVTDLRAAIAGPAEVGPTIRLTRRQQQILAAIAETIDTRGYPPTLREIGDAVGLHSVSSVAHQLQVLEQKGAIVRDPNRPRAITIRTTDT